MGFMKDGEDLMDAVTDAIFHNDYSHLEDAIHDTVHDVTDTINDVTDTINDNLNRNRRNGPAYGEETVHRASSGRYAYHYNYNGRNAGQERRKLPQTAFTAGRVRHSGLGRIIAGVCLGLFLGWPILLGAIALFFEDLGTGLMDFVLGLVFTIPSAWLIADGAKKRALAKRFSQYKRYAGNEEYLDIGKLARYTGQTKEKTVENLKQMMENGWLPGAWIDPKETTLILTENAYQQYVQAQESLKQRQREARKQARSKSAADKTEKQTKKPAYSEEVRKILSDGEDYRDQIHHANDLIPGEEMSEKLAQLETLLDRIFEQVKKKPEAAKELHSLMNYYLPTTMKLVNAYIELDAQPDAGDNIRKTKKEIEDALDTINAAFEKLLDSLFQDMAWDIESDIDVMETMFQRDGLTEDELHRADRQTEGKNKEKDTSEEPKKTWSQMKEEAGIKDEDEETVRKG